MNIKNLERAGQIAAELPVLEEARKAMSDESSEVEVTNNGCAVAVLPKRVNYNIVGILNSEINRLKEELKEL
jgi:hypothetical protein